MKNMSITNIPLAELIDAKRRVEPEELSIIPTAYAPAAFTF